MAEMALELIFKVFILIVAVAVIIGIIFNFQHIANLIKLPCFFPPCEEEKKCETQLVNEEINENSLKKYCDLCWHKTGEINLKQSCLCYVINGTISLASFSHPNCEWKCQNPSATSVFLEYDFVKYNISIKC